MLAEDYPTMLELSTKGEFKFIEHKLANYRFHGSQMTNLHIVDMKEKDKEFVLSFYSELSKAYKEVSGLDETSLTRYWDEKVARSFFSLGRRLAYAKEKEKSLNAFKSSYGASQKLKLKAMSILGIFSVSLGMNIEWMRIFEAKSVPLSINQ